MEGRKEGACDDGLRPHLVLSEMEANPPIPELKGLLCKLGAIRQANPALTDGVYRELLLTNRQYAFARILGNEAVITAVNNDANPVHWKSTARCPASRRTGSTDRYGRRAPGRQDYLGNARVWQCNICNLLNQPEAFTAEGVRK